MKYKYSRKQWLKIADNPALLLKKSLGLGDVTKDLREALLAKEQGEELCSHGREKWACLWPHKQPKKEQGEKKHKEAVTNGPPYCVNCGQLLTIAEMDRDCPTSPLKEDRREIKPLDVPSNYIKTWPTNEIMIYHKLCEIIDVINHLSSVEK